jgi:hypothetical protein
MQRMSPECFKAVSAVDLILSAITQIGAKTGSCRVRLIISRGNQFKGKN